MDIDDPERRGRIRVQCPAVLGDYLSSWCEPCIPYATDYAGDYYVPPVGEGIWVQFEEGDVNRPIWNGGWYKVNSTPLTLTSEPNEYRYIIFKDTVIRMGKREVVYELREGEQSYTLEISVDTWLGLNYISHYDENKILDLETLLVNKDWILTTRPEEENQQFEELQNLIASLGEAYNDFTQNVFPSVLDDIYTQIQQSYEASHNELVNVVEQINELSEGAEHTQEDVSHIVSVVNSNTAKLNAVIQALNDLEIDGEKVFPDGFDELEEI